MNIFLLRMLFAVLWAGFCYILNRLFRMQGKKLRSQGEELKNHPLGSYQMFVGTSMIGASYMMILMGILGIAFFLLE